jgi:hypothetical protein
MPLKWVRGMKEFIHLVHYFEDSLPKEEIFSNYPSIATSVEKLPYSLGG